MGLANNPLDRCLQADIRHMLMKTVAKLNRETNLVLKKKLETERVRLYKRLQLLL